MLQVVTDADRNMRLAEFKAMDADAVVASDRARISNRNFTQVYPKGWARLQELIRTDPPAARVYAFLAEHIDGTCGAVVVAQDVMASELGVHERTIRRLTKRLDDAGALVRIKIGMGVYAYALDPTEVWRSWDDKKDHAAFTTKTLVRKVDRENNTVQRKLKVMVGA